MNNTTVSDYSNNDLTNNDHLFNRRKSYNKISTFVIGSITILVLFLGGYMLTKSGHGPVAGVKGDHKVCTVKDVKLTYNSEKNIGTLNDDNIVRLNVRTSDCGDLIVDKDHLSNIDGMLYVYQNLDVNKLYEFRIVDGNYVNHINIAM